MARLAEGRTGKVTFKVLYPLGTDNQDYEMITSSDH